MTDTPLKAEDYEIISFRAPRKLGLSAGIKEAAQASGETRESLLISRLRTSLGITGHVDTRRRG